jgi:hypothetical protein
MLTDYSAQPEEMQNPSQLASIAATLDALSKILAALMGQR